MPVAVGEGGGPAPAATATPKGETMTDGAGGGRRRPPVVTAEEAVRLVRSGDRVYLHEAAMAPHELIEALVGRAAELRDVETVSLHTDGPAPHARPGLDGSIRHNALFVGANVREAVAAGRADYTPVFLSDIPGLIAGGALPLDVAFLQVSPPDRHGYCRLGPAVACARAAADHARLVVALVNPQVPRTLGNTAVHVGRFAAIVETNRPLPEVPPPARGEVEERIGGHVAALVPDGATLQLGIGAIPDAVLARLGDRADLGVHTEMFSDGLLPLVEAGVVTNRRKTTWRNRVIAAFAVGSRRLYDFVDDNPSVEFHAADIVNDTREIRRNERVVAINSAIEVDLTGQVVADSIGHRVYSGIGGQMDFVRGARLSPGGKAVIALRSTAKGGTVSRIVPELQAGAGVVTTRGHVQYVATEWGVVNLAGQSLRRRAELLISGAHPDVRAELSAALHDRTHSFPTRPIPTGSPG